MKAQYVIDLLKANKNRFTAVQLEKATGTARRARRALFLARKAGVSLEAIRDGGKSVVAYVFNGASIPTISEPVAKAKASKAKSPKAAVKAKTISKEVAAVVAKNKAPSTKTDEEIKAKNLATMKAVTKREKTALDKIKEDTRAEFDALEAEWEAEEAARTEQLAARVAVADNLPRANVLAD
jgi:hypothetical protein